MEKLPGRRNEWKRNIQSGMEGKTRPHWTNGLTRMKKEKKNIDFHATETSQRFTIPMRGRRGKSILKKRFLCCESLARRSARSISPFPTRRRNRNRLRIFFSFRFFFFLFFLENASSTSSEAASFPGVLFLSFGAPLRSFFLCHLFIYIYIYIYIHLSSKNPKKHREEETVVKTAVTKYKRHLTFTSLSFFLSLVLATSHGGEKSKKKTNRLPTSPRAAFAPT